MSPPGIGCRPAQPISAPGMPPDAEDRGSRGGGYTTRSYPQSFPQSRSFDTTLPRLLLDPDCIHEVEEHLPVTRCIRRHREMHIHPVLIPDEMAREVALLCRPSCRLEHHGEVEPGGQESQGFFRADRETQAPRPSSLNSGRVSAGSMAVFHALLNAGASSRLSNCAWSITPHFQGGRLCPNRSDDQACSAPTVGVHTEPRKNKMLQNRRPAL